MSGTTSSTEKAASGISKSWVAQVTEKRSQAQPLDTFPTKAKPIDGLGNGSLTASNLILYATHIAESVTEGGSEPEACSGA